MTDSEISTEIREIREKVSRGKDHLDQDDPVSWSHFYGGHGRCLGTTCGVARAGEIVAARRRRIAEELSRHPMGGVSGGVPMERSGRRGTRGTRGTLVGGSLGGDRPMERTERRYDPLPTERSATERRYDGLDVFDVDDVGRGNTRESAPPSYDEVMRSVS